MGRVSSESAEGVIERDEDCDEAPPGFLDEGVGGGLKGACISSASCHIEGMVHLRFLPRRRRWRLPTQLPRQLICVRCDSIHQLCETSSSSWCGAITGSGTGPAEAPSVSTSRTRSISNADPSTFIRQTNRKARSRRRFAWSRRTWCWIIILILILVCSIRR